MIKTNVCPLHLRQISRLLEWMETKAFVKNGTFDPFLHFQTSGRFEVFTINWNNKEIRQHQFEGLEQR